MASARGRPAVIRLDLLKVVGSRPARLASAEVVSPARSARRSSAVQTWSWVSIARLSRVWPWHGSLRGLRNYYLSKPVSGMRTQATTRERRGTRKRPLKCAGCADTVGARSGNSGKTQETQTAGRNFGPCARSTKFVRPRPGARPSGRASTAAAPTMRATASFIFRPPTQVAETATKHFAGQTGLFLVAVDADALGDALQWEPSRGGELFPASLWRTRSRRGDRRPGAACAVRRLSRPFRSLRRDPRLDAFSLPLLRRLDAEDAHRLAIQGLRLLPPSGRSRTIRDWRCGRLA